MTATPKTKRVRWVCPSCSTGRLAPSRLRKIDVRRYCLPCSERTGLLVEMTAPSLDAKRALAAETRRYRAIEKRQAEKRNADRRKSAETARLDARFVTSHPTVIGETIDMRRDLARVWRAARKVEPSLRERAPKLIASSGSGSYAYVSSGEIHLGGGASWHTLVHEVAHFVQYRRGFAVRSDGKRAVHDRAFYMILRDIMERLVPGLRVSFAEVTAWGYSVDSVISRQVYALRTEAA